MMRRPASFLFIASLCFAVVSLTGCGDAASTPGDTDTSADDVGGANPKSDSGDEESRADPSLCVGVRGNGPRIYSHFGAMARIHEHYGLIDGVAGGSSGSITTFLTESIYANPNITQCGNERCTDEQAALRVALMYKSLEGYIDVFATSDEVVAFQQLLPILREIRERDVEGMIEAGDYEEARQALITIYESEDIRDLINDEMLELLKNSPDPVYHVKDLWKGISSFGSFSVDSDRIFIRPGVLDFGALAEKLDRIASFYAAYGPADDGAWQYFLDACAPQTRGMSWQEIARRQTDADITCGELYEDMATRYRDQFIATRDEFDTRLDDQVGEHLTAMVSTSVIEGDAASQFEVARQQYEDARDYTFEPSFDDVRFGYWGQPDVLAAVEANPMGYEDLKTAKFRALGAGTYRDALAYSPAEPGMARALEIDDGQLSAGGWSDLEPSLVLENAGCDQVIIVTRRGGSRGFGTAVARLLGMNDAQADALYQLDGDSAVTRSLEEADGVWCTDWDAFEMTDIEGVRQDGYTAPLEAKGDYLSGGDAAYTNVEPRLGLPSCTPGVAVE
jgi:hypothetical protein